MLRNLFAYGGQNSEFDRVIYWTDWWGRSVLDPTYQIWQAASKRACLSNNPGSDRKAYDSEYSNQYEINDSQRWGAGAAGKPAVQVFHQGPEKIGQQERDGENQEGFTNSVKDPEKQED